MIAIRLLRTWCVLTLLFSLLAPRARAEESEKPVAPPPSNETVSVDLNKPDLLIVSESMTQLFRDVLKLPIFRDLLTEDFAFYYEHKNDGVLMANGALKRIAFEHEMTGLDRFISYVFDSPVEAAFWRGYDGKLNQFLITVNRSLLKNALEMLSKAVLDDSQLKALPDRPVDGGSVKVFDLNLNSRHLYLAASANKFFLYSKASMPLPSLKETDGFAETVKSLLGMKKSVGFFKKLIGKIGRDEQPSAKHSLQFSSAYLSFGYADLFPAVKALGLSFGEKDGWSSSLLVAGDQLEKISNPWKIMPKDPSLCVNLPVNQRNALPYLAKLNARTQEIAKRLLSQLNSGVGICWYAESKFFTPIFGAELRGDSRVSPADLQYLFQQVVGAAETNNKRSEKVESKTDGDLLILAKDVGSRYGSQAVNKSTNRAELNSKRFFHVTLVASGKMMAFSPDPALATAAANTAARRAPSLEETLHGSEKAGVLASPARLAALLRTAILDSLPASQESLFRTSVASYLLPSLDKMKNHPNYSAAVSWGSGAAHWEALEWQNWR